MFAVLWPTFFLLHMSVVGPLEKKKKMLMRFLVTKHAVILFSSNIGFMQVNVWSSRKHFKPNPSYYVHAEYGKAKKNVRAGIFSFSFVLKLMLFLDLVTLL